MRQENWKKEDRTQSEKEFFAKEGARKEFEKLDKKANTKKIAQQNDNAKKKKQETNQDEHELLLDGHKSCNGILFLRLQHQQSPGNCNLVPCKDQLSEEKPLFGCSESVIILAN